MRTFLSASLLLVALVAGPAAAKERLMPEQVAEIESRLLWSHSFEEGIVAVRALPGGFVEVETRAVPGLKKKKAGPATRWVLAGRTGAVAWSGPAGDSSVAGAGPLAVVAEQRASTVALTAVGPGGRVRWSAEVDGVAITTVAEPESGEVYVLAAPWWGEAPVQPATLVSLDAATGSERWRAPLGELDLPPWVDASALALSRSAAWIAAGGRAFRVQRADGAVTTSLDLPQTARKDGPAILDWAASDEVAALAMDGEVWLLDEGGLRWQASYDRNKAVADEVVLLEDAVIAGFRSPKRVGIVRWDLATGREAWRYDDRDAWATPGMAVAGGVVVLARRGKLVAWDATTGAEAWELRALGTRDQGLGVLEYRVVGDAVVAQTQYGVISVDLATGSERWSLEKVQSHVTVVRDKTKLAGAIASAGFASASTMDEVMAASMRAQADLTWDSGCSAGLSCSSEQYVFSPAQRKQLTAAAQSAERGAAWTSAGGALVDALSLGSGDGFRSVGLPAEIPADVAPWTGDLPVAVRQEVLDRGAFVGYDARTDLLLVDLRDGSVRRTPLPPPTDTRACVVHATADAVEGIVYQTGLQAAIKCKDKLSLRAYRVP